MKSARVWNREAWLIPLMLATGVSAGPAQNKAQVSSSALVAVSRYGWAGLADSGKRQLDVAARKAMGGVLARPVAVAEGKDGAVYVLDGDFRKIVVYEPDGSLRRVILGGYGQGPGEFDSPRDFFVSPNGDIAVVDQSLRRLTLFDSRGAVRWSRAIRVSDPMRIVESQGLYYVMGWHKPPRRAVFAVDSTGAIRDSLHTPSKIEYELGDAGSLGTLALGAAGEVLFGGPSPGIWYDVRSGQSFGTELVANQRAGRMRLDGDLISFTPAVISRIGQWPDKATAVYYVLHDPRLLEQGKVAGLNHLAVFSQGSSAARVLNLGEEHSHSVFAVGVRPGEFFLATNEPYPQVVRYRLAR